MIFYAYICRCLTKSVHNLVDSKILELLSIPWFLCDRQNTSEAFIGFAASRVCKNLLTDVDCLNRNWLMTSVLRAQHAHILKQVFKTWVVDLVCMRSTVCSGHGIWVASTWNVLPPMPGYHAPRTRHEYQRVYIYIWYVDIHIYIYTNMFTYVHIYLYMRE